MGLDILTRPGQLLAIAAATGLVLGLLFGALGGSGAE